MAGIDFSRDPEQTLLLLGFDVIISESEFGEAYALVTLFEGNNEAWSGDVPLPVEGSSNILEDVGMAAIDIFEAERGTLGQGAGADVPEQGAEVMANKMAFDHSVTMDEDWYLSFKGTQFEEVAFTMLEDLYSLELERATIEDTTSDLYAELSTLKHHLKTLNLQRLREVPAGAQVIIIQASLLPKRAWIDAELTQKFIDCFSGSELEPEVLKLINKHLDIQQELNKRDESFDAMYESEQEIRNQMESLSLELLQRNVIDRIPTEGIGAFPEMAADMAELMEGVSIDEPLMEMPAFHGTPFEPLRASKQSEVQELGKTHLGLDPSEIPADKRLPFERGDKVQLSKEFKTSTAGGVPLTLASGTKGVVQTEFDGHGNSFMVHFENGGFLNVPETHLKKTS